jgi:phosphoribosylformimino-5-aminoimidazole carboxamide ribotide isomerase
MKFRPCIDIHKGKVKQIVGSTLNDKGKNITENFVSQHSPGYYAKLFKSDDLTGGHIIMLGPGNKKPAIEALHAWPGGMQIGGGITPDNAPEFLSSGASHVIVTSYVFKNGIINFENLKELMHITGKTNLTLDLSCSKKDGEYFIFTDKWQKNTGIKFNSEILEQLSEYCDEFLVHAIDSEGKKSGIEPGLVQILSGSPIPATYAGGIHSLEDIKLIEKIGKTRVDFTVGSALDLFGGILRYDNLLKFK